MAAEDTITIPGQRDLPSVAYTMKRIFTQTVSGRYKRGQVRDWPMSTWNGLSNSLKMDLDSFTKPKADETFVELERAVGRSKEATNATS